MCIKFIVVRKCFWYVTLELRHHSCFFGHVPVLSGEMVSGEGRPFAAILRAPERDDSPSLGEPDLSTLNPKDFIASVDYRLRCSKTGEMVGGEMTLSLSWRA